jgi:hypothetical protein
LDQPQNLENAIGRLLPTPTSQAAKHGATPDTTANAYGKNLWDLPHLLPTPTCQDGANNGGPSQFNRHALPLNTLVTTFPDLDPTPTPWPDGNPLSDDPHPTQPTISDD